MDEFQRDTIVNKLRESGVGRVVSEDLLSMFKVKTSEERMIPTRNGETHVFIYYPYSDRQVLPLYINIHGGGFVKGHRQQDIVFCKNICSRAECVVVDIDYATAPEQKYPYALHQCYDVVKWAYQNPDEFGMDREKIAVGGHSAGGNFTAALTMMANQTKEFEVKLQILDYPAVDLHSPPELKRNAYVYTRLPPDRIRLYNDLYIDDGLRLEPTASPLFAPDEMLLGLPSALIITCGDDALGEEAEKYASRLVQAGVQVTSRRFLNSHHGFTVRRLDDFETAEQMILRALNAAFDN